MHCSYLTQEWYAVHDCTCKKCNNNGSDAEKCKERDNAEMGNKEHVIPATGLAYQVDGRKNLSDVKVEERS